MYSEVVDYFLQLLFVPPILLILQCINLSDQGHPEVSLTHKSPFDELRIVVVSIGEQALFAVKLAPVKAVFRFAMELASYLPAVIAKWGSIHII